MKLPEQLLLDEVLVAVVVQASQHHIVEAAAAGWCRERLIVLELDEPGPEQWATAAFEAAQTMT